MSSLTRDLRYAVRGLARSPGFSALAILTMALGIGATTAVYSVVDGVLLHPLPFPAEVADLDVRLEHLPPKSDFGTLERPETLALSVPPVEMRDLPFNILDFIQYELPWEFRADPDMGQ